MTISAVRARDTPGRAAEPQVVGVLIIDADNGRARYDCYRPGCPDPLEGPVHGIAIAEWSKTVRDRHVAQYHPGEQP